MSENREEILADFQACTGIEDVGEAIYHLEETNWDLLRAVSRVMPPDSQSFQPQRTDPDVMVIEDDGSDAEPPTETGTDMMEVGNNVGPSKKAKPLVSLPAENNMPSTSSAKMIKFIVQYCDRTITVELPDSATVSDLKLNLQQKLKIPPCRQLLSLWARMSEYEHTSFSKLMVPDENKLTLTLKAGDGGFSAEEDNEVMKKLNGTYTLTIKYESKTYNLKYAGTKTILDVKTDFYSVSSLPCRNQAWTGWPPNIDDQTMLALSGIDYPTHHLTVARSAQSNHATTKKSMPCIHIDSDEDEFEDASESFNVDDDYFVDNVTTKRPEPLIPEDVEDEIVGSITFSEQFTQRYGPIHPAFYQGTLEDAQKEACNKPAKDRKILAMYLHHDASVLTNVFCTQLLGFESVMQIIEKNIVLWGWDITFESNRAKLQTAVTNALGTTAAMSLRNIAIDKLPAIVLIMKIRSTTEIYNVVYGNVGVNELLSSLIECVEVFSEHQRVEAREEQERAERELVKWEQDMAYKESLEADRAKEEARRKQEQAETERKQMVEMEKAAEELKKEELRKLVEASLPPEPPASEDKDITKIRFRFPNGDNVERRFQATTPLKVLLDFLIVKGYPSQEYKVISSWPRRDLTSLDLNQSLKQLKLYPQETVILEER
ncbi:FAS-associated factor 1 [Aethina tumida]|uniref:FAS-associated factor 1 n=1 Tax=Aethina tumida TaxID=116153 RepID=UPI00096ADDF0|nr:FAS-associated factor 1 [Aethina tumida]